MYKFCAFDLDGTLVDTLNSLAFFCNQSLKKFGFSEIETEKYKQLVGSGAKNLVKGMLKTVGDTECKMFDAVYSDYMKSYNENCLYLAEEYEGITKMLKTLSENGVKLAVLSNKPHDCTVKIANALFGGDMFMLCAGNKENVPRKPDPTALLQMAEELGVKKEDGVYVGDSGSDMVTGKNAGMLSIGVLWGFRGREELLENGADVLVNTPDEIVKTVLGR